MVNSVRKSGAGGKGYLGNTGGQEAVNGSMDQLEAFRLDGKGSWQWGAKEY